MSGKRISTKWKPAGRLILAKRINYLLALLLGVTVALILTLAPSANAKEGALLRGRAIVNQGHPHGSPGAKAASDRYEAIQHGYMQQGIDPMQAIMHGYVPPGISPQNASMLYNSLPHLPKMPESITPENADQYAGVPNPEAGLLTGLPRAAVAAQNQQMFEESIRERFGPVYIPPLHRDPNTVAQPASKVAASQKDKHASSIPASFYTKDHLLSIREMTDSSGNIVSQQSYDPFGNATQIQGSGTQPDFGYSGYYVHSRSGLNLTLARAYSPSLGRFLNRDPIEENGGVNLFAYCHNNPINRRDPSGLYGNWGGPGLVNGGYPPGGEISNFPWKPGPGFANPTDARDLCYYKHDTCLRNCQADKGQKQKKGSTDPEKDKPYQECRQRCRRNCDTALSDCLQNVLDNGGSPGLFPGEVATFGGMYGPSPNDNPGTYVPGITPTDPGYTPPIVP